jgi:hypothetical protein
MKPESDKRLKERQKMRKHAKSIMKNAKKAKGVSACEPHRDEFNTAHLASILDLADKKEGTP